MSLHWSPQQEEALRAITRWLRTNSQVFYMAGFAGTGKTTLARHAVGHRWRFAALTGKAAHVLRQKGCEDASTIHSLIYRPAGETKAHEILLLEDKIQRLTTSTLEPTPEQLAAITKLEDQIRLLQSESEPRYALWANSPLADPFCEGVVIDECSMVDEQLGKDLESFGKKILVIGDPAQLPPVGSGGYFTKRKPDVLLTEIHRQARESGILRLATAIREGRTLESLYRSGWEQPSDCLIFLQSELSKEQIAQKVLEADQVLVGRNATRKSFNRRHRDLLGRVSPTPEKGDRLVCLRNDRDLGVFNGSQWVVNQCSSDISSMTAELMLQSEDYPQTVECTAWLHHVMGREQELTEMGWDRRDFQEFDYGHALTVHKSQGSQWEHVLLWDEGACFRGVEARWRYTGITRASRKLTVII